MIREFILQLKLGHVSRAYLGNKFGVELTEHFAGSIQRLKDWGFMTVEDDQLMTQMTGQQKLPLFAESETRFFMKVVDAQVEFLKDAQGAITHLVIHQGGRDTKAQRKLGPNGPK